MHFKHFSFKKSSLYGWITVIIWAIFMALYILIPIRLTINHYGFSLTLMTLLIINGFFIAYFIVSGLKDIIVSIGYKIMKKPELRAERKILDKPLPKGWRPKVILLYATCNDFVPIALEKSMQQDYSNYQTIILDDSQNPKYINQVNNFRKYHPNVTIIRRKHHAGFKAGNINHFLQRYHNYDYFVLLDSDEVIPRNFISKSLHYFSAVPHLGILQCTHKSGWDQNHFMSKFSRSATTFWKIYNTFKLKYGFSSMYGHGAMISRKDYEAVKGFPQIVAEDISFSLESTFKGFKVGFSNFIMCHEEYPINYVAFKKRQRKWASGNIEFIKDYTKKLLHTNKLHWYEKFDLFIFVYSLSIYSFMYLSVIICSIILPLMNIRILNISVWTLIPIIWFFFAQSINDAFVQVKTGYPLHKLPFYVIDSMILYGSMYWVTLKTTFLMTILKKQAKFIVTPKINNQFSLKDAIVFNYDEIAFGLINIIIIITFTGVCLASLLGVCVFIPGMLSPLLIPMSDKANKKEKHVARTLMLSNKEYN